MAYCSKCGSETTPGQSFCQRCGAALNATTASSARVTYPTAQRGGFGKFLKWGGIGCGGFIAFFVILAIVGSIIGTESENNTSTVRMTPDATSTVVATSAPTQISTAIPTPTPMPTAPPTPTPTSVPTPTPVPIQLELSAFLEEYYQNKVRANAKFRYLENGKTTVSTSGFVDEIKEHYVILTPSLGEYWSQRLYCYYADTRTALQLTRGERVSVIGRVSGDGGYSSRVHMFGCRFEGMQLETNPRLSIEDLRANVVQVFCLSESLFSSGSRGTGIIVDAKEGLVLTVHHIVADENECETIEVQLQGSENRITATPVKHCASIDRARLRIPPAALLWSSLQVTYRATAPAQIDQEIYFWGYGPGELRLASGVVTDVLREDVVTDAYAVPGDSGAPVFDENGHLLGIMSRSNRSDIAVFTGDDC